MYKRTSHPSNIKLDPLEVYCLFISNDSEHTNSRSLLLPEAFATSGGSRDKDTAYIVGGVGHFGQVGTFGLVIM